MHKVTQLGGVMMIAAMACAIPYEFTGITAFSNIAAVCTVIGLACFAPSVRWTRDLFIVIGAVLLLIAVFADPDWQSHARKALSQATFIASFFTALSAIRSAAVTDPSILECGRFLASQPPGRRYLALSMGGHLFGLVLMYGSISLLGALATENAAKEPNPEIRAHRTRRMLVAIQRGFLSTLAWSPLAFASAVTLSIVPGANWATALPLCLLNSALLVGIGWAMDTIFKPRLSAPPPPRGPAEGQWLLHLRPLFILLGMLMTSVAVLHFGTGVRVVGVVTLVVPLIAFAWVVMQDRSTALTRAARFATQDIPALRGEIVLLSMAGFIGTMGGHLAAPLTAAAGLDLTAIPTTVLLLGLFWLIPITGQLGMNPILAVSLIGPLLPTPEAMGITPALLVAVITGAWSLAGTTSPFTASVLLVGNFGKVSPNHVGIKWNGAYALTVGAIMSAGIILLTI